MDLAPSLRTATILVVLVFLVGISGYWLLGGPAWSLLDAVYMTTITLATIGYGETHDLANQPGMRVFTIALILSGIGTMTYFFTTLTEFIVEGRLQQVLARRRMSKGISEIRDHVIVLGAGDTGLHIIDELARTRQPFVVIDADPNRMERLLHHANLLYIVDEGTDDEVLQRAGIERARGILVCLPSDKDNLFVTMSARQLNPGLRIVAKASDNSVRQKLLRAGADAVVSPALIGGLRLVSEMIRPTVVGFLDSMIRDEHATHRIEEVHIEAGSVLVGQKLGLAALRQRTGGLVLALREAGRQGYVFNPDPDVQIHDGAVLVVMGDVDQVQDLRKLAATRGTADAGPTAPAV